MSQWLRSNRASSLFLYSSWVLVSVGIFLLFLLTPWFREIDASPIGDIVLRILGGALGIVAVPASIFLGFGMLAYCLLEDPSRVRRKVLWCLLFLATASFGSAAYFFKVYKKQVRVLANAPVSAGGAGKVELPSSSAQD